MEQSIAMFSNSYDKLTDKLQSWGDLIILNVPNLVIAILVTLVAAFSYKYFKKVFVKATSKYAHNQTMVNLFTNLFKIGFIVLVMFLILTIFSLNGTINKILATAGVLGLAIGLALQDPMNNMFSGVFMSVRKLYKIGDLVETNGYFGTIIDIDLRATKLRIPTGQVVTIPNKDVIQKPLKNYTVSGERRIDLPCGVSYGDNLDHVESVVLKAIKSLPNICKEKPVEIVYTDFGDSSINFKVRYWLTDPSQLDYLVEKSRGIKAIKEAFDDNDVMIPFPIRTLDFGIKGGENLKSMLTEKSFSMASNGISNNN